MINRILSKHGGIIRSSELIARGVTRYRVQQEVAAGRLIRFKKGWLAAPTADPQLIAAASAGLTLSCVTQAQRLGLWVRKSPDTGHFSVPRPGSERRPPDSVLHYHAPIVPRGRFALVDEIENVLALVAQCEPFEDAVATWDSALNKKLVDRAGLEHLPLPAASKRVLEATDPFADSGLESYVRVRLSWLRLPIVSQAWLVGRRVDFLIGSRLVVQIDGGHHVGPQRTDDIEHDAQLKLRGYTVIRVSYTQIMHSWPETQALIMRAVAAGLHQPARLP
ncbi:MAG: DUF559 domain-containing protein [Leucobacter sp.]